MISDRAPANGRQSVLSAPPRQVAGVATLGGRLNDHLERQLAAARRLLACVLEQGQAIRDRAVDRTVEAAAAIRNEVAARERLEEERALLLAEAGRELGILPEQVTLERICTFLPTAEADQARRLSTELRGILAEISREHHTNRVLLRQELAFLEHLLRLAAGPQGAAYRPDGDPVAPAPTVQTVIDRRA